MSDLLLLITVTSKTIINIAKVNLGDNDARHRV